MKVETYVEGLKKGVGHARALQIAQNLMVGTNSLGWGSLPSGPVFYREDNRGAKGMNERHLRRLHAFWTQAYYILKKGFKK